MTWRLARQTPDQTDERRLEGPRLLRAHKLSQAAIARAEASNALSI
jgi:hypothetical protein